MHVTHIRVSETRVSGIRWYRGEFPSLCHLKGRFFYLKNGPEYLKKGIDRDERQISKNPSECAESD